MEAASKGAHDAGGLVVGIVPGSEGNQFLEIIIKTEMGHARNVILIESADAVIAVGGSYGTLSEIAVALRTHTPVYGLNTWKISGVHHCTDPPGSGGDSIIEYQIKNQNRINRSFFLIFFKLVLIFYLSHENIPDLL